MWVQITEGNQKKGCGVVDNFPSENVGYDFNDKVYYETNDDGITRPYEPSTDPVDEMLKELDWNNDELVSAAVNKVKKTLN